MFTGFPRRSNFSNAAVMGPKWPISAGQGKAGIRSQAAQSRMCLYIMGHGHGLGSCVRDPAVIRWTARDY